MDETKAFADDKLNVGEIIFAAFGGLENVVEKRENAGNQHFLFFPTMFSKRLLSQGHYKLALHGNPLIMKYTGPCTYRKLTKSEMSQPRSAFTVQGLILLADALSSLFTAWLILFDRTIKKLLVIG